MPSKHQKWALLASVLFALMLWQLISMCVDQKLLMVSPITVLMRLTTIWQENGFAASLLYSCTRIVGGFLLAFLLGALLGGLAARFRLVEIFLWPYVLTIKSVPVASFIIIALIWLTSGQLSVFISFLMVFPIIYANVLTGLRNTDHKMLEMAKLFHVSAYKRLFYIELPQLKPFILSACGASFGIAWKAGIAAEVIGIPTGSIGERLYEAKIYLNTADLFAWTVMIVLMSVVFEKLFMMLLRLFYRRLERL
ncbi:MAG: ABC transporter permease subunit [Clostridia bacterium]